jgi:acetyl esterase/lipase
VNIGKPKLIIPCVLLQACSFLHAYDVPGYAPDQVIEYKQTLNSTGGAVSLSLDVFTPPGHQTSDSRPAIVFFFGGGWSNGSPSQFHPHCEYLASRGMVAVSAEYRVSSLHGTTPKECVKDGKSAIRYLRENAATLGIDPNRIAAGGGSAGGHVAASTGTLTAYEESGENLAISSKPNALVLFNPVFDNGPTGYGYNTVQAYWQDISPLHNIDATAPPTVVFLGTSDALIPVATAENYKGLMEAEGRRCDLHLYEGQPHGFFNFEVPNDGSGPWYGYQNTVFKADEFLVSLGYLSNPHATPTPASGWVTIFGDAGFSGGSQGTASPVTTDADADSIAANIDPVNLADGEFIRLTGSLTLDVPMAGGQFRVGLYEGDDPVTAGDGTGYVGIWAEAPATTNTKIAAGDGMGSSHPFETAFATDLGPVPAAAATVPASTPVDFSLMIIRNGASLDISASFTDGASYNPSQNLLNVPVADYSYNSIAFLMAGSLNGTEASFSNIGITKGPALPAPSGPGTPSGLITYVDAVEGASGNTFATGGSLANTSWVGPNSFSSNSTQWNKRLGVEGNGDTLFQGSSSTNSPPELTTRITGLADGTYNIWAFYWDQVVDDNQNWVLSAGLNSGSLGTYSSPGEPAVGGATTAGVANAASLTFSNPVAVVGGGGLRNLFGINLGQVDVAGGAAVSVHIGNNLTNGSNNRAWFDGVGYEPFIPALSVGDRVLSVDFNRDDAFGAPSQSLFRIVSGSSTQNNNASTYSKTIGARQVTISQPNATKFEFRGANGDSSRAIPGGDTSLSYLVSDFIATREGAIDLEITGLAAGDYVFRSHHLDTFTGTALGFAQGATSTTPNSIEARIGGVVKDTVQPTALGSVGLNTTFINDSQIPKLEFSFSHDGLSPLIIELRSTLSNGSSNFLLLNGFEIFQSNP